MSINLALILTLLTAFTGIVYLLDVFVWHDSKRSGDERHGGRQTLVEYSRSFFPVLLIVLVIRSFVFEPFRIPSGSMMPTLLQGDFIFVKKFSYGLRLPVTETKVLETGRRSVVTSSYSVCPRTRASTTSSELLGCPAIRSSTRTID